MALPSPAFPGGLFDGREQDTFNDGAPDPQKYQALDYNKLSSEIVSLEQQLRDGAILAVKNDSGGPINQGDLIRLSGFDPVSNLPRVQLADASSPSTLTDAVALQTIANGSTGNIGKQFVLRGLNTQALGPADTPLFLDTTPGAVTATPPVNSQTVGLVLRQSVTVGVILFEVSATALVGTHTLGGPAHLADTLANLNALITGGNLDFDTAQRPSVPHALGSAVHLADTLVNLNAKISDATLDDVSATRDPNVHPLAGAEHSADTLANLNAKISDATLDDISGARTPVVHALGGAEHSADTLANLNSKITGGSLDFDTASRSPNGAASGQLGGTYPSPDVRGIRETGGATLLTLGAIADGEVLKRQGSSVVGTIVDEQVASTVTTTDSTPTTLATIPIPDDTVVIIEASISARRTDSADRAGYIRRALVFREAAGIAVLQGSVDTPFTRESSGLWNVTIDVDGGNNARIRVTGQAANTINWRSEHRFNQVS